MGKKILDATCGSRMIWFNKRNPNCLYVDKRILHDEAIWKSTSYDEYFDANGEECLGITWEGLAREEFEKIKEKYGVEVE